MHKTLIILPLLGLAACATPRESCIAAASRDLTVVNQLISQTELNVARGYGIDTRQEVRSIPRICYDERPDGTVRTEICDQTYVRDVSVPVALDLDSERAKLRQLKEQRNRLKGPTDAAVRQCVATYPE
jgi:hypothetical protein